MLPTRSAIDCNDLRSAIDSCGLASPLALCSSLPWCSKELGPLTSQCRPSRPTLSHRPLEPITIVSFLISLQGYLSTKPLDGKCLPILQGWLNASQRASTIITCFSWKMPQRESPRQQKTVSPVDGWAIASVSVHLPSNFIDCTALSTRSQGFCMYLSTSWQKKELSTFSSFSLQLSSRFYPKRLPIVPSPWSDTAMRLEVMSRRSVPIDSSRIGCTTRTDPTSNEYLNAFSLTFDTHLLQKYDSDSLSEMSLAARIAYTSKYNRGIIQRTGLSCITLGLDGVGM